MQAQRIWDKRKPIVSAALQRHSLTELGELTQLAAEADRAAKGLSLQEPWGIFTDLLLALSKGTAAA